MFLLVYPSYFFSLTCPPFCCIKGGPYSGFAGRDASRGLATFSVSAINEEYDDLSDLKPSEMEQVREWELQFSEKYTYVGKLLKPGEQPTSYSDEEDDEDDIEEIPRHDDDVYNKKKGL